MHDEPTLDQSKFTRPNGVFETSEQNQITFVPNALPPSISYDSKLIMLLAQAERKAGELKGKGSELENPDVLIWGYLKREAVLSSKIEGILASLEDLNRHEAVGNVGKKEAENLRLQEVVNYIVALGEAIENIDKPNRQIDLDVMRTAHKTLMNKVKGGDKNPGGFRTTQNYIIKTRGTTSSIIYTAPPPEKISDLLENIEKFLQIDHKQMSPLIQCAIIHYQFEAIHPFRDGNGRIGRLLLPLILYKKGLMSEPLLYLSAYFDKHRQEYYNGLLSISQKSRWEDWIAFFLKAFIDQADETIKNIQKWADLKNKYKKILAQKKTSGKVILLMEHLFSNPYITVPLAVEVLDVTYPTAKNAIKALVDVGILKQTDIIHTGKVFLAEEIEEVLNID